LAGVGFGQESLNSSRTEVDFEAVFPIASLSIAGISNKHTQYRQISDFSDAIEYLKKKCKRHAGNYFEII